MTVILAVRQHQVLQINTPEKLQQYKKKVRRSLATERRLKDAMEKLTLKSGDEHLHKDFETIMHALTEEVVLKTRLDEYMGSSNYRLYIQ